MLLVPEHLGTEFVFDTVVLFLLEVAILAVHMRCTRLKANDATRVVIRRTRVMINEHTEYHEVGTVQDINPLRIRVDFESAGGFEALATDLEVYHGQAL